MWRERYGLKVMAADSKRPRLLVRWNMGPCQHKTWLMALSRLATSRPGMENEFCTLRQWRGFQIGARRFMVRMNLDFCHDKHELARVLQADAICRSYLPETYLSIEDFVNSGASDGLLTG